LEGQGLGFAFRPHFLRQGLEARFSDLASDFGEGQTLANDAIHGEIGAVTIIMGLSLVLRLLKRNTCSS
jgi:hypothetical protein